LVPIDPLASLAAPSPDLAPGAAEEIYPDVALQMIKGARIGARKRETKGLLFLSLKRNRFLGYVCEEKDDIFDC